VAVVIDEVEKEVQESELLPVVSVLLLFTHRGVMLGTDMEKDRKPAAASNMDGSSL
jgi:sorbitol-specific phosphotransferase system component IIC